MQCKSIRGVSNTYEIPIIIIIVTDTDDTKDLTVKLTSLKEFQVEMGFQ